MKPLRVIGAGLSLCCLVLVSSPVEAGPFGGRLEDKVARMQDQLGLSDGQAADVLEIFEAARADTTFREVDDIDACGVYTGKKGSNRRGTRGHPHRPAASQQPVPSALGSPLHRRV